MATYSEKLKNPRWQKKRLGIFNRDQFECKICGDKETTLHVHHVYYEANSEPWDYADDALVTLCGVCHEAEHEAMKVAMDSLKKQIATSGIRTSVQMSYLESVIRDTVKDGVFHG